MQRSNRIVGLTLALTFATGAWAEDLESFDRASFSEVWTLVRDQFFDPEMRGVDWNAARERYAVPAAKAATAEEFAAVVNAMLAELGTSHTRYFTRLDPEYYQLMAIFHDGLADRAKPWFPDGVRYTSAGLITEPFEDGVAIRAVLDGSPAAAAGLRAGDLIVAADGEPFRPVASFDGKSESDVVLTIRRGPEAIDFVVRPSTIDPNEEFALALEASARTIELDGRRVGYVHVWSYAGEGYQALLKSKLVEPSFSRAEGLILDLREGWGGANPDYLHMFDCTLPGSVWIARDGTPRVGFRCWDRPVVLLVNERTRSGKEWFTYGFKAFDRGLVVGTRTAGAVTAGRAFVLRDGSLLMIAVADLRIDGMRLEGRGVEPDIQVPFDPRTADGSDPQLDRAVRELVNQLGPVSEGS